MYSGPLKGIIGLDECNGKMGIPKVAFGGREIREGIEISISGRYNSRRCRPVRPDKWDRND